MVSLPPCLKSSDLSTMRRCLQYCAWVAQTWIRLASPKAFGKSALWLLSVTKWQQRVRGIPGVGFEFSYHYGEGRLYRKARRADTAATTLEAQFTDDSSLFATSRAGAEIALDLFNSTASEFGLTVSATKAKFLVAGAGVTAADQVPPVWVRVLDAAEAGPSSHVCFPQAMRAVDIGYPTPSLLGWPHIKQPAARVVGGLWNHHHQDSTSAPRVARPCRPHGRRAIAQKVAVRHPAISSPATWPTSAVERLRCKGPPLTRPWNGLVQSGLWLSPRLEVGLHLGRPGSPRTGTGDLFHMPPALRTSGRPR